VDACVELSYHKFCKLRESPLSEVRIKSHWIPPNIPVYYACVAYPMVDVVSYWLRDAGREAWRLVEDHDGELAELFSCHEPLS
jgi:hypothetical protein